MRKSVAPETCARLAVKGRALGRRLTDVAGIVTPDTILRWYRQLVAKKYDGSKRRGAGRPATRADIAELVVRMARENRGWGYTRIRGGLKSLGHEVARNTASCATTRPTRFPFSDAYASSRDRRRSAETGPRMAPLSPAGVSKGLMPEVDGDRFWF